MAPNEAIPTRPSSDETSLRRYFHLFTASLNREDHGHAASYWPASLVLWIVTIIGTPIAVWCLGEQVFPHTATLGVVTQTISVVLALGVTWSAKRVALSVVTIAAVAFGVEALGVG